MQQVAKESSWFTIAASVFAFIMLAPFVSLALLWFGTLGAPLLLSLLLPVTAISAGSD